MKQKIISVFDITIEKKNLEKVKSRMKDIGIKEMSNEDYDNFHKEVHNEHQ